MEHDTMTILQYSPEMDQTIDNKDALARGTGCRYVLCVRSHQPGRLVAKAWKRSIPKQLAKDEVILDTRRKK